MILKFTVNRVLKNLFYFILMKQVHVPLTFIARVFCTRFVHALRLELSKIL